MVMNACRYTILVVVFQFCDDIIEPYYQKYTHKQIDEERDNMVHIGQDLCL